MSHLQKVRGQNPPQSPRRTTFVAAAALSIAAGAVAGASLAGGTDWLGREVRLAAISVRGGSHLAAADVAAATGVTPNAALSAVEPAAVEKRLEEHVWITGASALQLPGGTLLVSVTERIPVARVSAGTPPQSWLVDASGMPFAPAATHRGEELPHIVCAEPVAELAPNEAVARAARLARDLPRFGLAAPALISVAAEDDPAGFALTLPGLSTRIVLGREDLDEKLRELAQLLAADLPGLTDATEIDLRFADQAILRSEPLPEGAAQAAATRGHAPPSS
jgi:cell division septal protein FtsQ